MQVCIFALSFQQYTKKPRLPLYTVCSAT